MIIIKKEQLTPRTAVPGGIIQLIKKNTQISDTNSENKGIVLHYTVGAYNQVFDSYHYNIASVGNQPVIVQTLKPKEKGQHLFGRNSGMIGITLCCLKTPKEKPTLDQLECMSLTAAEVACWQNIDIREILTLPQLLYNSITQKLVPTGKTIKAPTLTDHAFFGKSDLYGSPDIKEYKEAVIKRTKEIYQELKKGKRKFQLLEILK